MTSARPDRVVDFPGILRLLEQLVRHPAVIGVRVHPFSAEASARHLKETSLPDAGPDVCRAAHEAGALVSIDAFHSVGILPVDVRRIGADFVSGGVLKWLCGGPGGCFLYVAPSVRDTLEPALTGWQAHARPFAFEPEMEYADDAFRWLNGTPVIPALYAAAEGPKIVHRAGVSGASGVPDAIRPAEQVRRKPRFGGNGNPLEALIS